MKFLVSWTTRDGASAEENEASVKRGLQLFSKWSPPAGATFHQFLSRMDGNGGYAVVESDDVQAIMEGPAKFSTLFAFNIVPVVDIMDAIAAGNDAIEFRDSIS